jgi:hypothetical protein
MRYVVKRIGGRGRKCIVRRYVENKVGTWRMRDERAGQGGWLGTTPASLEVGDLCVNGTLPSPRQRGICVIQEATHDALLSILDGNEAATRHSR